MSEVPDRNAASASAEASNPFAPIDYASRLKAPSKHTGAFHAMQPLQPGQLYGAAPWMSPPKPLASNPAPQESGEVPSGQGASSFSSAFPPYAYPSPTRPVSSGESAPSHSDIPPYLKRRPVLGRDAAHAEPPQEARVDVYSATDFQPPLFPDETAAEPAAQSRCAHPSSSMRPTAPAAAGWRVIRWRKPPSPTQRQKAKPPLPLRTRCPLCRRCRRAFPSSRPPGMLLFRRKLRCSPREGNPARPMRRRFSPARPTGLLLRMTLLPFRRNPSNSPRTKRTPFFAMLRTSRPCEASHPISLLLSCEILSLPLCMRMPRRKKRPPAFPRRTGRQSAAP